MALTKRQRELAEIYNDVKITPGQNLVKLVADEKVRKNQSPEYYEGFADALVMALAMLNGPREGLPGPWLF